MTIQQGPAFGAMIIGGGIAFLIYQKTNNAVLALGIGTIVGLLDYGILVWAATLKKRKK